MHDDVEYISRSQKKRDSAAAQKLGETIASLTRMNQEKLELPQAMLDALAEWRVFPGHEAKRRQMQYIGRLMRELNMDDVQKRLDALLAPNRMETASLHAAEAIRDSLLEADSQTLQKRLDELTVRYPTLKMPHLRHLAQTATAERAGNKPPKAYRELFQILKKVIDLSTDG